MFAFTQVVPISDDLYWKIVEQIGPEPFVGAVLHLATRRPDGGIRYLDVWETKEAYLKAVDERIHPAVHALLQESGINAPEPSIEPVEVLDAWIGTVGSVPARP